MPKETDWPSTIEKLKARQKELQPGDTDIIDISGCIQEIEANCLGGNLGHAQYFLEDPGGKKSYLRNLRKMIKEFLPQKTD